MTTTSFELTADGIAAQARWLRRLTRILVVQEDRADDVLQETLLVALQHQGRPVRSIRPWLARVAFNFARKLSTEAIRRRELERDCAAKRSVPTTGTVVARAEMQHGLSEAVLSLDEPYRSTILLHFLDELSCAEVARHVGVPVETVRTRVKRGLKLLRAKLDGKHGSCRAWAAPILGVTGFERLASIGGADAAVLSSIVLGGSMGKFLVAMMVAVLAVLLWTFWPDTSGGDLHSGSAQAVGELSVSDAKGTRATEQREPVAADPATGGRPATTGSLSVRVLFSDGATPASGIRLAVKNRSNPDPFHRAARLRTDANGAARVAGIEVGRYFVETDRESSFRHQAEIEAGEETRMTIVMKKGLEVTGIVVNRDGTPVPGAEIMLEYFAMSPTKIEPVATTGADGRFTVRDAMPHCCISAIAKGYVPSMGPLLQTRQGAVELRLVLPGPAGVITGRVEDQNGDPIARALVRIGVDDGNRMKHQGTLPDGSFGVAPIPLEVYTDEEGNFRAESVTPGSVAIGVRSTGLAPFRGTCNVFADRETTKFVRLLRGAVCTGTVRDSAGAPMTGVEVRSGQRSTIGELQARTTADGTYRLAGLPPGEVEMVAVDKDRTRVQKTLRVSDGQSVEWNATFSVGTPLHGRVLTDGGDPVVNGTIYVIAPRKGERPRSIVGRTRTDREGRFRVPRCPEGVSVQFSGRGYKNANRSDVVPGDGEIVFRVHKVEFNVTVKGRVVGPFGEPIGGARVECGSKSARTDIGTGGFTIGRLSAGSYQVRITAKGFAEYRTVWRDLAADETWDLDTVRVVLGGRAEVTLDRSKAGTSVWITMLVYDANLRVHTVIRTQTVVAYIPPVAPGHYRLGLRGKGIAAQLIPCEVVEGETAKLKATLVRGSRCELRLQTKAKRARITIEDARGVVVDRWVTRSAEGHSVIRPYLAPGRYVATAQTAGGETGKVDFAVSAEKAVVIDVPLR